MRFLRSYRPALVLVGFALLAALACASAAEPQNSFVPGISPTVTPHFNPQGTPSRPISITPDLPDGWRWQYAGDWNRGALMRDAWFLLGIDGVWVGAIHHSAGNDCWFIVSLRGGEYHQFDECHLRDDAGREAVKLLATDADFKATRPPTPTPAPTFPPTPTPDLTTLAGRYQAAGQELHHERSVHNRGVVVRWADGSHWEDGVSHELPDLPLDTTQKQREGMTCIQAEALEAATFPNDMADRSNWQVQPNAAEIAEEWERRHSEILWGPDDELAVERLRQDPFTDWCGQMMQPAR